MKHAKNVDVAVFPDEVCDAIVAVNEDADVA